MNTSDNSTTPRRLAKLWHSYELQFRWVSQQAKLASLAETHVAWQLIYATQEPITTPLRRVRLLVCERIRDKLQLQRLGEDSLD